MLRKCQTGRRTYNGKENGLVVCPGKQYSSIEMVLHCIYKSQNKVYHRDGSQGDVERWKAEVHGERGGWGMFEGVMRRDSS
jgi:hypothetical protein